MFFCSTGEPDDKKKERKSYTCQEKAGIILRFLEAKQNDPDMSYQVFSDLMKIPDRSMLHKWVKNKDSILKLAIGGSVVKKNRPVPKNNPKHAKTHTLLYTEFLKKRNIGKKISFLWIFITGRKIANFQKLPSFTRWAAERFCVKFNVKIRRVQRKKQKPKTFQVEKLKKWYADYRYVLHINSDSFNVVRK